MDSGRWDIQPLVYLQSSVLGRGVARGRVLAYHVQGPGFNPRDRGKAEHKKNKNPVLRLLALRKGENL